jgi:hypothetical protein
MWLYYECFIHLLAFSHTAGDIDDMVHKFYMWLVYCSVSISDCIASDLRIINEQWIWKHLEENIHGLI